MEDVDTIRGAKRPSSGRVFQSIKEVPLITDESFLSVFFINLTGDPDMAEALQVASAMYTKEVNTLALALMTCFGRKGRRSLQQFLDRRGARPLRRFLCESIVENFPQDSAEDLRAGRDKIVSWFQRKVDEENWERMFVATHTEEFGAFRAKLCKASMACVVAICNQDLPVADEVVEALKDSKELTRNVAYTVITALMEALWMQSSPLAMAVNKDLVAKSIMLLCLALMTKFGDELSLRTIRASLRDFALDIEGFSMR